MNRLTFGELWAGSDGWRCTNRVPHPEYPRQPGSARQCPNRTFTLWFTDEEWSRLCALGTTHPQGPEMARYVIEERLGQALCCECSRILEPAP